ncbi:hypothetical protein FB45DRAFT_2521 [Roridomyces roridus]|uniref:C2H2-type domain-containing protein n=1 Tax=Roridomyces roridus TaxID=1738132 RepID=A0AAD7FYA2_9AGAR|nr:hypothetical protein FB45DRAFT_2521 [Roridomyces roridus]
MSFISSASGFTLGEGTFNNVHGPLVNIFQPEGQPVGDIGALLQSLLGDKWRRREESTVVEEPARGREDTEEDDGLEVVRYKDLRLTHQIGCGPGYHLHAGNIKLRAVIVKVFNAGTNARKHWQAAVSLSRGLLHPNVLRIEGISAPTSVHRFIAYEDAQGKTAEGPLAAALKEDLDKSIMLGFKMISDLSSGMYYLSTLGVTLPRGPERFDVFLDINDRFLLNVNPPTDANTTQREQEDETNVWTLFNGLCQKVLRSANRVLHDEDIERKPTVFDSSHSPAILEPSPVASQDQATLQNEEAIPNNRQNAAAVPPRREFVWRMMDLPQSLATIAAQITRDLDLRCMSINRLVSSNGGSIHRCPGYIREEVTLAIRTADSAVVSHDAPTIQEVCSICHEVVNSGEVFRCVCRQEEPGSRPTVKCRSCKKWSHRDCGPTPNESICYFCTMQNQQYHLSEHHTTGSSIAPSTAEEDGDFTFNIEDSPPHRENEVVDWDDAASITAIRSQSFGQETSSFYRVQLRPQAQSDSVSFPGMSHLPHNPFDASGSALKDDDCDEPLPPTRPSYGQLRLQEPMPSPVPFSPEFLSPHWPRNLRVDTTPELLESGWQPSQYFPASPPSPSPHSPASLAGSETSSAAPVSPGTPSYLQLPNPMIVSPSRQRSTHRGGSPRRFLSIDPSVNGIDRNLDAQSIEETPQPDVPYPTHIHDESYMGRLIPQDFGSLDGQAGYEGPSVTPQGPQTDLEEAWRVSAQVSSSLSPIPRPAAAPTELEANDIHNAGTEHAPSVTVISGGIRKVQPRRKERSPYPPQHRKADGQGQADDASGLWDGQMSPEGPMSSQPIRAQVGTDAKVRASTARRKDPFKIGAFICNVCGHDFTAKHNLTNHMNSHLVIKNFECGCGEQFGTAHVLKRHKAKCSSQDGSSKGS